MKVIVVGKCKKNLLDGLRRARDKYLYISDFRKMTIVYPFCGKIYYEGKEVNVYDYDCAIIVSILMDAQYMYDLLSPHIPVFANPYSRRMMHFKVGCSIWLSNMGVPVAKSLFSKGKIDDEIITKNFDRCIEKPKDGTGGQGISWYKGESKEDFIYQEYIDSDGVERWIVVGGKIVSAMRKIRRGDDLVSSYNWERFEISITDKMQSLVDKIEKAFPDSLWYGLDIFRIDDENFVVCEVNSVPGNNIIDVLFEDFYDDIVDYLHKEIKKIKGDD